MKKIIVVLVLFALLLAGCGESKPAARSGIFDFEDEGQQNITAEPATPQPVAEAAPDASAFAQEQTGLRSPDDAVLVYDDEYVTISFLGCEKKSGNDYMVFYAVNKTKASLTFDANSMAINGESLGYVYGIESVAPESKGKIRFKTEEQFPTMEPDTISGEIDVYDFSFEVMSGTLHVPFSNVSVK